MLLHVEVFHNNLNIFLVLFAVFYLIYLSAKTVEYIRSLFRFNIIKKIKERRKSEKREDENAVNEVIETEPDPQSFENPETQLMMNREL